MILALINNKGGVAKTTTALNVAAALAETGERTLVIDLDSQGAASLSLGLRRSELRPSAADLLMEGKPLHEVVRKTSMANLELITGSNELAGVDVALANAEGREHVLKRALEQASQDYANIIIDCPPSLSLLSVNALMAAEAYVIPVSPHYLTMGGLASIVEEVNRLCDKNIGDVAELLGVVLTMVDYRSRTTAPLVNSLRKHWQEMVFDTEIKMSVKLSEAPASGKTILEFAPNSSAARLYRSLADEIAERYEEWKRPLTEPDQVQAAQ
jgi:chromosome partitioning protein